VQSSFPSIEAELMQKVCPWLKTTLIVFIRRQEYQNRRAS